MLGLEEKPISGTTAVAAPLISAPLLSTGEAEDNNGNKTVLSPLSPQVDDIKSLSLVPRNLEDPIEVPDKTDPLEKFKPLVAFINKIKFPLAGAGATSHLVAAIASVVKLIKKGFFFIKYKISWRGHYYYI